MVEYSTDGSRFTDVARVNSRGNSLYRQLYAYSHLLPAATGMAFYRIRAVDKNGSISYSNTVQLKPGKGNAENLLVVPNITSGNATVSISSNHVMATKLQLLDAQGRVVLNRPLNLAKGLNTLPLDVTKLSSGIYYVSVVAGDGVLTGAVVRR